MKKDPESFTNTLVAAYTVKGYVYNNSEPTLSLTEKFWLFFDPNNSLCLMGASQAAEAVYQWSSNRWGVNTKLRNYFLPPDKMAVTLNKLKLSLRALSAALPDKVKSVFPLDILLQDLALFASRANTVLKLNPRIQACIEHTGTIAKETLIADATQTVQSTLHSSMKQQLTQMRPSEGSDLGATLWDAASSFVTEKGSQYLAKTVNSGAVSVIDEGVSRLKKMCVDTTVKKEKEYLDQLSTVVVDTTAKKILNFCFSTFIVLVMVGILFPAGTKWGLSCVMSDAAALMVTISMMLSVFPLTGVAVVRTVADYRKKREAIEERFAPLETIERTLLTQIKDQALLSFIPSQSTVDNSALDKFRQRCEKELPEVFDNTANSRSPSSNL